MTIDEAIEILESITPMKGRHSILDIEYAIRLGIEALRRERIHRRPPYITPFGPLPGETEEMK